MKLLLLTIAISCAAAFKLPIKAGGFKNKNATTETTSPKPSIMGMFSFTPQITVSKFPPIFELIVQRIQAQFSNYVHEDLSRPQTFDKPVYTLAPDEIHLFNEDLTEFKPPIMVMLESFELINSNDYNSSVEVEYEIKTANKILHGTENDVYSYNTTILDAVKNLLKQKKRSEEIIGIIAFNETINYNIFGEDAITFANRFNESVKKNVSAILEKERKPKKSQILIAVTKVDDRIFANVIEVLKGENREKFLNYINAEENLTSRNNNSEIEAESNYEDLEVVHQENKNKISPEELNEEKSPPAENIFVFKNGTRIILENPEYDHEIANKNKGYDKTDYEQEFADAPETVIVEYEPDFNEQQKKINEHIEESEIVVLGDDISVQGMLFNSNRSNSTGLVVEESPEEFMKVNDAKKYALEYEEKLPLENENYVITNYERNSIKPSRRIFHYREERDVKTPKKKHSFRPKPESIIVGPIVVKEETVDVQETAPKDVGQTHLHLPMITGYLDGEDETFYKKEEVEYDYTTKRTTSWPLDEIGRK